VAAGSPRSVCVVRPQTGWPLPHLTELWAHRELLAFLVWRDLAIRYKQTVIGVAWAVLQPLCAMVVFGFFFGKLAKVPSDNTPYALFALAALVPWGFFATGLTQASLSLVVHANLVKKVYFPRPLVPMAAVLSGTVDLLLSLSVLLVMALLFFGRAPSARLLLVPVILLLPIASALGIGLLLAAVNARYRDVQYAVPFLAQLWMFASPVVYPSSLLSEPWRTVYALNPMVGAIEGLRWAVLGADIRVGSLCAASVVGAILLLVVGATYFAKVEHTLADVV
jgi:lipopolysaccharide transport system permease protein